MIMEEKIERAYIAEICNGIKGGLENWCDVCMRADFAGIAAEFEYNSKDLANCCNIFLHVAGTIGISSGKINFTNSAEFGKAFRGLVYLMTGIDLADSNREIKEVNL